MIVQNKGSNMAGCSSAFQGRCPSVSYGTYEPCSNCRPAGLAYAYNPMANCENASANAPAYPSARCDYRERASRNIYDASSYAYGSACDPKLAWQPARATRCNSFSAMMGEPYSSNTDGFSGVDRTSYGFYAGAPVHDRQNAYGGCEELRASAQANVLGGKEYAGVDATPLTRSAKIASCYPSDAFSAPFGTVHLDDTNSFARVPFVSFSAL